MQPGAVVDYGITGFARPAGGLHAGRVGVVEVEDTGVGDGSTVEFDGVEVGTGLGSGGKAALAGRLFYEN